MSMFPRESHWQANSPSHSTAQARQPNTGVPSGPAPASSKHDALRTGCRDVGSYSRRDPLSQGVVLRAIWRDTVRRTLNFREGS
jgi:hypothetical protein